MEYLDLNLTEVGNNDLLSIGTESNEYLNQQGGFLLKWGGLGGSSDVDKIALEAAQLRNYAVVDFLIKQGHFKNFGSQDDSGSTILHYLAREDTRSVGPIVQNIIGQSNVKGFIDVQDKNGDTPLHVAVKAGNHDMADLLVQGGSDKTKKNKEGEYVASEDATPTEGSQAQPEGMNDMRELSQPELSDTIRNVVNTFLAKQDQGEQMSEGSALPLNMEDTEKKSAFMMTESQKSPTAIMAGGGCGDDTETFLNNLISKYGQSGGAEEGDTTEAIVEDMMEDQSYGQCGGARFGRRQIPLYDGAHGGKARELSRLIDDQSREIHDRAVKMILEMLGLDENKNDELRTGRRLKGALFKEVLRENREISAPLDLATKLVEKVEGIKKTEMKKLVKGIDAHDEAVQSIVSTLGVAEDVARNIKAVMWKNLRAANPDVSNLLLSVMLGEEAKKAKKAQLEKIDPEEGATIRDESRKRRNERRDKSGQGQGQRQRQGKKERKPRKQSSDSEPSATSAEEPPADLQLSETSFSD